MVVSGYTQNTSDISSQARQVSYHGSVASCGEPSPPCRALVAGMEHAIMSRRISFTDFGNRVSCTNESGPRSCGPWGMRADSIDRRERMLGLAVSGDYGCLLHFEIQVTRGMRRFVPLGSIQRVKREHRRRPPIHQGAERRSRHTVRLVSALGCRRAGDQYGGAIRRTTSEHHHRHRHRLGIDE